LEYVASTTATTSDERMTVHALMSVADRMGHQQRLFLEGEPSPDELDGLDFFLVERRYGVLNEEGTSYSPGDALGPPAPRFEFEENGDIGFAAQWVDPEGLVATIVLLDDVEQLKREFRTFLEWISEIRAIRSVDVPELAARIEVLVSLWREYSEEVPLDPEDRRVADAIVEMASEVSKVGHPPREILGPALRWLGRKVDVFVDEAVKVGGKAAGVGLGAAVTGQLPRLGQLLADISKLVS
jgi:hypothetical protein